MKVVYLINGLGVGGGERVLVQTVLGLRQSLQRASVYCLSRLGPLAQELREEGIVVQLLRRGPILQPRAWGMLFEDLRHAELLHTHFFYSDLLGCLLSKAFSIPMVATRHETGFWMRTPHRLLEPMLIKQLRQVLCVSSAVQQSLRARKAPAHKLIVVPPGVASAEVSSHRPEEQISAVGRLERIKGHDLLLRAVAELFQQEVFQAWRLFIIGDGSQRGALERLCQELGLEGRVVFTGTLEPGAIAQQLRRTGIFVQPSRHEGLPLSLLEAMSVGIPCVASTVGGIGELIEHEKQGLLVPPDDKVALGGAVARLMSTPELRSRLGEAGRKQVDQHYALGRMLEKTRSVYESLRTSQ